MNDIEGERAVPLSLYGRYSLERSFMPVEEELGVGILARCSIDHE